MSEAPEKSSLVSQIARLKALLAQREKELEQMRRSRLFLETLFDGIEEEIMILKPDFTIVDVNRALLRNWGMEKGDVVGRRCHEIAEKRGSPCSVDPDRCPLERARENWTRVEVEHKVPHRDRTREFIRVMYPLGSPGDEEGGYFVEITREVTEHRELLRKVRASEQKFKAILDTANDAILSIDEQNRIILFNDAAERIFGYKREEVIGKSLNMLVPPQYGDHYLYVRRFVETGRSAIMGKTLSLTALRKGGEEFPIELGLSYFEMEESTSSSHKQAGFTAIIRDVSEQRQLEKKLLRSERLAAVGEAVAHVAHEIRNPLMIIGGFSRQIRNALTDQKALQKLDMILEEVERLERLVQELGDFTRDYKLIKRPAQVNSVVNDVLSIMIEAYPRERYRFLADLDPNLGEIYCDPDKLKQVFINIVSNSIEAMEAGGTVMVSTRKIPEGVEIRISDQGTGIKEQDLLRIFEPFYTTRERGSGLGLAISYRIVEAHRGDIWAESRPGEGATFVIRLPER